MSCRSALLHLRRQSAEATGLLSYNAAMILAYVQQALERSEYEQLEDGTYDVTLSPLGE